MLTEGVVEGFAVETVEGWILTVKGLLHPRDRWTAYLRYLPDPSGDRERAGVAYRRVYRFQEQVELLRAHHPEYLYHDPALGLEVQSVPRSRVAAIHDPCAFLSRLRDSQPIDAVQADALALAGDLVREARVPAASLGLSGSVMLGLHRAGSDLDLVVYGRESCKAVHRALGEGMAAGGALCPPDEEQLRELHAAHSPDTPLSFEDFARLQRRKVNEGRYRGRALFLRFVQHPAEFGETYGQRRTESAGRATVRATVCDDTEAIYTPCRYGVRQVTVVQGVPVEDLREIISYRGRFSDQARAGEIAEARGSLERVVWETGESYHRLVVGGQAGDWLVARTQARVLGGGGPGPARGLPGT